MRDAGVAGLGADARGGGDLRGDAGEAGLHCGRRAAL